MLDVIEVPVDIKHGSARNTINLRSKGTIPVAVLSTERFDATAISPYTITLAGVPVRGADESLSNMQTHLC